LNHYAKKWQKAGKEIKQISGFLEILITNNKIEEQKRKRK
jgi:hypothetical protein